MIAPIAHIHIADNGDLTAGHLYAPGLPKGSYDVYIGLEELETKITRLRETLRLIEANKLNNSPVVGDLYAAGISAGMAVNASIARAALNSAGQS